MYITPGGRGLWPAHWLYPQNRDWKMEYTMEDAVERGNEPRVPYGTLHYGSYDGQRRSSSGRWESGDDLRTGFHLYALEWESDTITVFPQYHDIDYVRVYQRRGAEWRKKTP